METCLKGKLLVSMPSIDDTRFARAVIFICDHTEDYAMGLVINKPMAGITLSDVLGQLDVANATEPPLQEVLNGGPVGQSRGFVLHSAEKCWENATMDVGPDYALTATREILAAFGSDAAPARSIFCLGYAGWGPGQLERELSENVWLIADPDDSLVFDTGHADKWSRALAKLGIPDGGMIGEIGHA